MQGHRTKRKVIHINGIVQGVGFRPTLARLAHSRNLGGSARNLSGKVELVLEGEEDDIDAFIADIAGELPPNARIDSLRVFRTEDLREPGSQQFRILSSRSDSSFSLVIPADLAMCSECAEEIMNPASRRYGYPFTTCTNCGPRYTIINDTPYDRERTTMSRFPMCSHCASEYRDPLDRRYHAETLACPACGPALEFRSAGNRKAFSREALREAREQIAAGGIVAVKGIGGFLLAADAANPEAVRTLRARKDRPDKPFAVMMPDLRTVREFCIVPPSAAEALASPRAPIVILDLKPETAATSLLPVELITPDGPTAGIMLPTSPLHYLLFHPLDADSIPAFKALIMTSGNRRGEPICISNDEALRRLSGIADAFLVHDREINLRNDDSVGIVQANGFQLWRRARGYAPEAIYVRDRIRRTSLAMGPEMKNTIAVGCGDRVFMSPHIGDMDTPEALNGLLDAVSYLPGFLKLDPEVIAVDFHPDMQSTIQGNRMASDSGLPIVNVQHHYSHAIAGLAEHGLNSGLALAFDGTGLGTDGSIWGAEMLSASPGGFSRLGTFRPSALPGGDSAVRHPLRQAVIRMREAGLQINPDLLRSYGIGDAEAAVWEQQAETGINSPLCHSAGRLLDSFAAMIGLAPQTITYDGQPAIRMEHAAACHAGSPSVKVPFETFEKHDMLIIDWRPAFAFVSDLPAATDCARNEIALAIHFALADAAVAMVRYALESSPHRHVVLTGGVFMNRILTEIVTSRLTELGITPLIHRKTPPNDACVSFGQALIAGW